MRRQRKARSASTPNVGRAALLVLAVAAVLACSGPREVRVKGDETWTDSGLRVAVGQEVRITASGAVYAGPTLACGPEGFADKPEWDRYSVLGGAPHIALIGRIGSDGQPFYVGSSTTLAVDRSGTLYLGVNDRDAGNNRGGYVASVEVR